MNITVEINSENIAVCKLDGSINSTNAIEFETALKDYPGDKDGIIIDAKNLEYISSAGLRVILSAKKRSGEKVFKVINVNNDVNSIFEMTGFSEIMDISTANREISVVGCKMIGHGACGECYRLNDETIVKLYYPKVSDAEIEREKAFAKKAFVMGVPTAISYDIVQCDGRKGVIYELIKSKTLSELFREDYANKDKYIKMYADTVKKINAIHTDDEEIPSFKIDNRNDIKKIVGITDEERDYLYRFIDEIVPDGDNVIHGDLNINNIMVENCECLLIDMGELSKGTGMWDLSRVLCSMVYTNPDEGYNDFYKLDSTQVKEIFDEFIISYFGCDLETAVKTIPEAKYLLPLSYFRACVMMIRENRFPQYKVDLALDILRNKLIPYIKENLK